MDLSKPTLDEVMERFRDYLRNSTYEPDYHILTPNEYETLFGVSIRPKIRKPFTDKDGNYVFYPWADSPKYRR